MGQPIPPRIIRRWALIESASGLAENVFLIEGTAYPDWYPIPEGYTVACAESEFCGDNITGGASRGDWFEDGVLSRYDPEPRRLSPDDYIIQGLISIFKRFRRKEIEP